MAQIMQAGQAGTIESNDISITIMPAAEEGIVIELVSPVVKQYGARIRTVIIETLAALNIRDAKVYANDKGALDCTIKARVQTTAARALLKGER